MSAATDDPTGIAIPDDKTYYTHLQVKEMNDEITATEAMLNDPKARLEDRGEVIQHVRRMRGTLDVNQAPETTPEQRTELAKEEKRLLEEITRGMPSQEEMRKAPSGALGKHQRWEAENKRRILRWKNIRRTLYKGDDDPDLANLERHRPVTSTLNMENAQIPGKNYFLPPTGEKWDKGWDRTFGNGAADPAEVAKLMARIDALEKRAEALSEKPAAPDRPFTATCPRCDKVFHGKEQHRADFGRNAHMRTSKACKPPEETV